MPDFGGPAWPKHSQRWDWPRAMVAAVFLTHMSALRQCLIDRSLRSAGPAAVGEFPLRSLPPARAACRLPGLSSRSGRSGRGNLLPHELRHCHDWIVETHRRSASESACQQGIVLPILAMHDVDEASFFAHPQIDASVLTLDFVPMAIANKLLRIEQLHLIGGLY